MNTNTAATKVCTPGTEELVFEDHAPNVRIRAPDGSMSNEDVRVFESKASGYPQAKSESLKSVYGSPASGDVADALCPKGKGGLVWHVQIVSDDWRSEKDCDDEGRIKPRRPTLPVRSRDFFSSLVKTRDSRYIFSGVLNGWPGLTSLELRSITCKVRGRFYGSRIKCVWDAEDNPRGQDPWFPKGVKSVRATLTSPPWSARGWSKTSPGCVWWYFAQREEGDVLEYGEDIIRRTKIDAGKQKKPIPQAVRAHLFAHRYSRGKKKETKKDRITYHAAVLLEWDHQEYCTLVELATLNGVGGRRGKSNWFHDKFDERPQLYRAMPPEMIMPWKGMFAEIRCADVEAKNIDEFKKYVRTYEGELTTEMPGGTLRFLDADFTHSNQIRLTHRSQEDIARYLLNYMGRDRRYTQEFRNCQAFAADFFGFVAGKKDILPYHAIIRMSYKPRKHLFLYNPDMYAKPEPDEKKVLEAIEAAAEKRKKESDPLDWSEFWEEDMPEMSLASGYKCLQNTCSAFNFPEGVQGKTSSNDGCTNGIALSSVADSHCDLECKSGYHVATPVQWTCNNNACNKADFTQGVDWGYYDSTNGDCGFCQNLCEADPECHAIECGGGYCSWWKWGACVEQEAGTISYKTCRPSQKPTAVCGGKGGSTVSSFSCEEDECEPFSFTTGMTSTGTSDACTHGIRLKAVTNRRCSITCEPGYASSGSAYATCNVGGGVASSDFSCTPKMCDGSWTAPAGVRILNPCPLNAGGQMSAIGSTNTCNLECEEGYSHESGAATVQCGLNGGSPTSNYACAPNICAPLNLDGGIIGNLAADNPCSDEMVLTAIAPDNRCDFACATGYTGSGTPSASCGINGGLPDTNFACNENTCESLNFEEGVEGYAFEGDVSTACIDGEALRSAHRSSCYVRCMPGYSDVEGSTYRRVDCGASGGGVVYTGQGTFRCVENTCDAFTFTEGMLSGVGLCSNGQVLTSIRNTACALACKPGYDASGTPEVRCGLEGGSPLTNFACAEMTCQPFAFTEGVMGNGANGNGCSDGVVLSAAPDRRNSCDLICEPSHSADSQGTPTATCGENGGSPTSDFSCTENVCEAYDMPAGVEGQAFSASVPACVNQIRLGAASGNNQCGVRCKDGYSATTSNFIVTCPESGGPVLADFLCTPNGCDASLPSGIQHMIPVTSCPGLSHGSTCAFDCESGYAPSGSPLTCSLGQWSDLESARCVPEPCSGDPTDGIDHASSPSDCDGTSSGETCAFSCGEGYAPNPTDAQITCHAGAWLSGAGCDARLCEPTQIANSDRNLVDSVTGRTGDVVPVSCDAGYTASEDYSVLTCGTDGVFAPTTFRCVPNACTPTHVPHSNFAIERSLTGSTGDVRTIACDVGYSTSSTTVTCSSEGNFEPSDLSCDPNFCASTEVAHSDRSATNSISGVTGQNVTVACDQGFSGGGFAVCNGETGMFDVDPCVANLCTPAQYANSNASETGSVVGSTGDVVLVSCSEGYEGGGFAVCGVHGTFSALTCDGVPCAPAHVQNSNYDSALGAISGTTGQVVDVMCDQGYAVEDGAPSEAVCGADGHFSLPVCAPQLCSPTSVANSLLYDANASLSGHRTGDSVDIECAAGYSGSTTAVCLPSGSYSDVVCSPNPCVESTVANAATPSPLRGNTGDILTVTCLSGFSGGGQTTCDAATAKFVPALSCDPDPCSGPPTSADIAHLETASCSGPFPGNGTECIFTCFEGYTASGPVTCSAGRWNAEHVSCDPDPCLTNPASLIPNADADSMRCTNVTSGSSCVVVCDEGYHIEDVSNAQARCSTGAFELPLPVCAPNPCADSATGAVEDAHVVFASTCAETASGGTCSFQCMPGYENTTTTSVSCFAGEWQPVSGDDVCVEIDECATLNPCDTSGTHGCVDLIDGYRCNCTANHFGVHCASTHNDCNGSDDSELCGHGTCVDHVRTDPGVPHYDCTCDPGWSKLDSDVVGAACVSENLCDALVFAPGMEGETGGDTPPCTNGLVLRAATTNRCALRCASGYTASSSEGLVQCQSSGGAPELVDNFSCSANPCDDVSQPSNGNAGDCSSPLSSGESCRFDCDGGYSLSGPTTCVAGTLTDVGTCDPDPCENIAAPSHGSLDDGACSDGVLQSGESCSFACNVGYSLSGVTTCDAGNLTHVGTCIPDPCPASLWNGLPANGNLGSCTSSQLLSGSSCSFSCDLGYTLSGPTTCIAGSLVQTGECVPDPCPINATSDAPDNGNVGDCPASLSSGSSCSFACRSGFTLGGATSCHAGRLNAAICLPDPCASAIVAPEHGSMGNCPSGENAMVSFQSCTFDCDPGWAVSGTTYCYAGSLDLARCMPLPCEVNAPLNGNLGNCSSTIQSGTSCKKTCSNGYHLESLAQDQTTALTKCLTGALVSDSVRTDITRCHAGSLVSNGTCEENICPAISTVANGTLAGANCAGGGFVTSAPVECAFHCAESEGYTLASSTSTVACAADGTWPASFPSCEETRCPSVSIVASQTTAGATCSGGGVLGAPTCEYHCEVGYSMRSDGVVSCQIDGTWEEAPSCEMNSCPSIMRMPFGSSPGASCAGGGVFNSVTCPLTCAVGYSIEDGGASELSCQLNGTWSKFPSCVENVCPSIDIDASETTAGAACLGGIALTSPTCSFSCAPGYTIAPDVDTSSIECDFAGDWPTPFPTCVEIDECATLNPCNDAGGVCEDLVNAYVCHCNPNYYGQHCSATHDDCSLSDPVELCGEHGTCRNIDRVQSGEANYECICDTGYEAPFGEKECTLEKRCAYAHSEPQNGTLAGWTCDERSVFDDDLRCTYTCAEGFELANASAAAVCSVEGRWLTTTGICTEENPTTAEVVGDYFSENPAAIAIAIVVILIIVLGVAYRLRRSMICGRGRLRKRSDADIIRNAMAQINATDSDLYGMSSIGGRSDLNDERFSISLDAALDETVGLDTPPVVRSKSARSITSSTNLLEDGIELEMSTLTETRRGGQFARSNDDLASPRDRARSRSRSSQLRKSNSERGIVFDDSFDSLHGPVSHGHRKDAGVSQGMITPGNSFASVRNMRISVPGPPARGPPERPRSRSGSRAAKKKRRSSVHDGKKYGALAQNSSSHLDSAASMGEDPAEDIDLMDL
eukprot:g443.t1